ncbi:hypothetical protein Rs2_03180 [Raphanus sativus]|nr:hypothetical protein Rs2_03180 [Raphanus sativus]
MDNHTESSIDTANQPSIDQSVITSIDSDYNFHSTSIDSTLMYKVDHFPVIIQLGVGNQTTTSLQAKWRHMKRSMMRNTYGKEKQNTCSSVEKKSMMRITIGTSHTLTTKMCITLQCIQGMMTITGKKEKLSIISFAEMRYPPDLFPTHSSNDSMKTPTNRS